MAKKIPFNMRMDPELKSWLDSHCSQRGVHVSGLVHGLLEAVREDRILVFPRHAPGVARAFPGSCPSVGSSPDNPALIARIEEE
jgi:hypothetical protein